MPITHTHTHNYLLTFIYTKTAYTHSYANTGTPILSRPVTESVDELVFVSLIYKNNGYVASIFPAFVCHNITHTHTTVLFL